MLFFLCDLCVLCGNSSSVVSPVLPAVLSAVLSTEGPVKVEGQAKVDSLSRGTAVFRFRGHVRGFLLLGLEALVFPARHFLDVFGHRQISGMVPPNS